MARRRLSVVERVAMELRQIEAEDAAKVAGSRYPYTAAETWDRASEVLRSGYREVARRIVRVVRNQPVEQVQQLAQPEPPQQLAAVPPVDEDGAPLRMCTVCGTRGAWGPGWCWYGSWRDVDEGRPYTIVCSDVCRAKHAAALQVDPEPVDNLTDEAVV
jgi:hypothetical protein